MTWGYHSKLLILTFFFATTSVAQTELVTSGSSKPQGSTPFTTPSGLDYASTVEIQIEEVCLGQPGLLPSGFSSSPTIQLAPFFGQHFNKSTDFNRGANLVDPIRLDQHERLSDKESHSGHYVFKDLKVSVRLADVLEKLNGTSAFYPQTDDDTGESSIEFYGVNVAVKSGLSQMVASRWAFNGDNSTRFGQASSQLLEPDPITGDLTKLNTLWPATGVLVNTSRRFVTTNDSFFGSYTHKHHSEHPKCDRSPYIIYSVKKSPSQ